MFTLLFIDTINTYLSMRYQMGKQVYETADDCQDDLDKECKHLPALARNLGICHDLYA